MGEPSIAKPRRRDTWVDAVPEDHDADLPIEDAGSGDDDGPSTIDTSEGIDVRALQQESAAQRSLPSLVIPYNARPLHGDDPPPRLPGFEPVARFQSSGATDVYLGYQASRAGVFRRTVIKWLARGATDFGARRQMLLDEARAMANIDHPNVVTIIDAGEEPAGAYLALEYVAGADLRYVADELRLAGERLPIDLACYVIAEVLRGLDCTHSARAADGTPLMIVHRDVDPSNVLVANTGHVKLTDFGVVFMRDRLQGATMPGTFKGKFAYCAPESLSGQVCDHRADIYGAGLLFFELLAGVQPYFQAKAPLDLMRKIAVDGVPVDRLRKLNVPEALSAIVAGATAIDPEQRTQSADEMMRAIEGWLGGRGIHVSPSKLADFLLGRRILSRA